VGHGQQLTAAYLAEFLGGSVGLMSPVIAVLAALGLVRIVRSATMEKEPSSALLAAGMVPFLAYLLLHSLHDRVQANWMAPLYPSFAICAAAALGAVDTAPKGGRVFGRLGRWAIGVGVLFSALLYGHAAQPLVLLSGQRDPTSQTRGWRELAAEVERLRASTGACWVATSSYATTGQLAYALKDKAPVVQLTERIRYLHLPAPDPALLKCPALYVELERRAVPSLLNARFASVTGLESITRSHAGVPLAAYAAYLASGADAAVLRD
jgi:hypothetical protein